MRILHTADWHIGQELRGFSRAAEHALFLDWLAGQCVALIPDALVVAGDVFDQANPSSEALGIFFRFVETVRTACPEMALVAVAGNHDSALRFDALAPAMREGVHLIGSVPRSEAELARLLIPAGNGHILAAPYFRLGDLPLGEGLEVMGERVRALYSRLWDRLAPPGPCVVTGHLTVLGGAESPESERPIFIGGEQAAPLSVFPEGAGYVALGHLHRAQAFAAGRVQYSGSPLPLSAAEQGYRHGVVVVEFDPSGGLTTRRISVPRSVPMLRLPESGGLPPEAVPDALAAMLESEGIAPDIPSGLHPFVEVWLALDAPRPHAGAQVVEDIRRAGLSARVVGVHALIAGSAAAEARQPADVVPRRSMEELFRAAFAARHAGTEPAEAHLDAFRTALEALAE